MKTGGDRTLAIDPTSRGFCFAVLQGEETLLDWGCVTVRKDASRDRRERVGKLMRRYKIRLVVLEDMAHSRRRKRARIFADDIEAFAREEGIAVLRVSRRAVQEEFQNVGTTKERIALAIARFFPELAARLPRPRTRPYMNEDARMNIFDALSFALTAVRTRDAARSRSVFFDTRKEE